MYYEIYGSVFGKSAAQLYLCPRMESQPGKNTEGNSCPLIALEWGIGSQTDASGSKDCRCRAIFGPEPDVHAQVLHIKPNFVSHHVSGILWNILYAVLT